MRLTRGGGCAGCPPPDGPPPGFRMLEFDDVPLPIAGEPARLYDVYPAAPAAAALPCTAAGLHRRLAAAAAPRSGGGLWRRQQPAFPMIINPPPGQSGPGFRRLRRARPPPGQQEVAGGQNGPAIVNQPPPGFSRQPGFQGPPKAWQKARYRHRRRSSRPAARLQGPAAAVPDRRASTRCSRKAQPNRQPAAARSAAAWIRDRRQAWQKSRDRHRSEVRRPAVRLPACAALCRRKGSRRS